MFLGIVYIILYMFISNIFLYHGDMVMLTRSIGSSEKSDGCRSEATTEWNPQV